MPRQSYLPEDEEVDFLEGTHSIDWKSAALKHGRRIAGTLERVQDFGEFKWVPRKELLIGSYQRPVSQDRVRAIVFDFQPHLFQPLWVARRGRGESLYVVDGRHRLGAADLITTAYMPKLPCHIYPTRDEAHEAQIFVWLQEKRRRLSTLHRFYAKLAYEDPDAVQIMRALKKFDFKIADQKFGSMKIANDNVFTAIGALEQVLRDHKREGLEEVLEVIRTGFDGVAPALTGSMVRGIARFLESTNTTPVRLARAVKGKDAWTIIERATRRSHSNGILHPEAVAIVLKEYL